jgi:protein-disulfide isomerase
MRRPLLLALLAVSGAPACLQKPAAVTVAPPPAPPAALEDGAAVPVSTKDPSWGSRTAPVTVVLFGDLECPFTGKILPTVQALESKYGESSLRIVWKDYPLPFHP